MKKSENSSSLIKIVYELILSIATFVSNNKKYDMKW